MDYRKQKMISDAVKEISKVCSLLSSMYDELSSLLYPDEEDYCENDYVVNALDKIKESNPNQTIIIETPGNSASCKLKDALIYIGAKNEIVIDAE